MIRARRILWAGMVALGPGLMAAAVRPTRADTPDNAGAYKVMCASWIGGAGADTILGVRIEPDGSVVLAGNADVLDLPGIKLNALTAAHADAPATRPERAKSSHGDKDDASDGFVLQLTSDGQHIAGGASFPGVRIQRLRTDQRGLPYIMGRARMPIGIGKKQVDGEFIARLSSELGRVEGLMVADKGSLDFDVDFNDEVIVLSPGRLTRYALGVVDPKWSAEFSSHGENRPSAIAINSATGIAVVTGYGMTRTGHEPYKDPYAYGFDRAGRKIWSVWNPDPTREVDAKFGGNGLMADTTGRAVVTGVNGKSYVVLYADGGNTVCTRDPLDADKPLDPGVMKDVFQPGAGFGFKGASKTSVIFRIDPATGAVEKGTWMSAWLSPTRANALGMSAADADENGNTFIVGDSASNCPIRQPWYTAPAGGYQGGGFLAIFDKNFKMLQCGYFPGTSMRCVACSGRIVVIAGIAKKENRVKDPTHPDSETVYPTPSYQPLQKNFGGGENDGYVVILQRAAP